MIFSENRPPLFRIMQLASYNIEEISARAVFDFHNPGIGVEFYLPREIGFDIRIGCGLSSQARRERARRSLRGVKCALRCRAEQIGSSIEPADAHENGAGFFRPAPPHDGSQSLDLAASQIGGNPKRGFQAHCICSRARSANRKSITTNRRIGDNTNADAIPTLALQPSTHYSTGRPVITASSLKSRSESRPVTGSLCSLSNFSIATLVASLRMPEGLIWP
jgi:hypothetical protein